MILLIKINKNNDIHIQKYENINTQSIKDIRFHHTEYIMKELGYFIYSHYENTCSGTTIKKSETVKINTDRIDEFKNNEDLERIVPHIYSFLRDEKLKELFNI
jgi:5-keto 4-deoxyuronate isomerase